MKATYFTSFSAACLLGAAGFLASYTGTACAHEGHVHGAGGGSADAGAAPAAPPASRNHWGADYFPNVPLVNQDGATVRLYDDLLKGKAVAINVIYTQCTDECPMETANLARLQRILGDRVGKDIFFYSISIDPENDTPQALKAYMKKFDVGPGWQFLTGKPEDIKLVAGKLGLSRGGDALNRDGHTASLMVGDVPGGQWLRNSAVDNPQFLAAKIGTFLGKWKEVVPKKSYAEVSPLNLAEGQYLYQARCSACHTIGEGARMGPDLQGVTARRDRAWLARYIHMPNVVHAEGDSIAAELARQYKGALMPNLNLGTVDVASVISYLDSRGSVAKKQNGKDAVSAR